MTGGFDRRVTLLLVGAGVVAFVALLWLTAIAPDLRGRRDGGAHALSVAATGFSGIVELARATGLRTAIGRDPAAARTAGLLVVTLPCGPRAAGRDVPTLDELVRQRGDRPTLLVLPKYRTAPDPKRRGFVLEAAACDPDVISDQLRPFGDVTVGPRTGGGDLTVRGTSGEVPGFAWLPPAAPRTIAGAKFDPVLMDGAGAVTLAGYKSAPLYVLAEPDLLNNHGLRSRDTARAALLLLRALAPDGGTVVFDVTQNGFFRPRGLLRLAFQPPFLAVTLALLLAALLAGWRAAYRFGPARVPPRALAFGKAALVDNAAALIARAGRTASLGARYAAVAREQAARAAGAPPGMAADAVDRLLDRIATAHGQPRFTELAAAAGAAHTPPALLAAARALSTWKDALARDRR